MEDEQVNVPEMVWLVLGLSGDWVMETKLASWLVVGPGPRVHDHLLKCTVGGEKFFKFFKVWRLPVGKKIFCLPMPVREEYRCPA